jgi:hypothetical protein
MRATLSPTLPSVPTSPPYLLKAKALAESTETLRQVAENSDQMIWLRDPHTRQFFYISPAYEKMGAVAPKVCMMICCPDGNDCFD